MNTQNAAYIKVSVFELRICIKNYLIHREARVAQRQAEVVQKYIGDHNSSIWVRTIRKFIPGYATITEQSVIDLFESNKSWTSPWWGYFDVSHSYLYAKNTVKHLQNICDTREGHEQVFLSSADSYLLPFKQPVVK